MARAGFDILEPHDAIDGKGRCGAEKGKRRVLRADELREWSPRDILLTPIGLQLELLLSSTASEITRKNQR